MANQFKKRGDIQAPNTQLDFIRGDVGVGTNAGDAISEANPEDSAIVVQRVIIDVDTPATDSSATLDIGVASDATTSDDTLIDGLDVHSSSGTFDNIDDQGTNGNSIKEVGSSEFITGSEDAGDLAGLSARYYIEYRTLN